MLQKMVFVGRDIRETQSVHIVKCRTQADGISDIWRSSFETGRRFRVSGLFKSDIAYHVSPTLPRGQDIVQLFLDVNNSDARWPEDLVTRKSKEIAAQLLHIHRECERPIQRPSIKTLAP